MATVVVALFAAFAIVLVKTAATDVMYAMQGRYPPRVQLRLRRLTHGYYPPGLRGFLRRRWDYYWQGKADAVPAPRLAPSADAPRRDHAQPPRPARDPHPERHDPRRRTGPRPTPRREASPGHPAGAPRPASNGSTPSDRSSAMNHSGDPTGHTGVKNLVDAYADGSEEAKRGIEEGRAADARMVEHLQAAERGMEEAIAEARKGGTGDELTGPMERARELFSTARRELEECVATQQRVENVIDDALAALREARDELAGQDQVLEQYDAHPGAGDKDYMTAGR